MNTKRLFLAGCVMIILSAAPVQASAQQDQGAKPTGQTADKGC